MKKGINTIISGVGQCLPTRVISNQELIDTYTIDSSHDWVVNRTGITQRYFCTADENVVTLATGAAREALSHASINTRDIDAIFVATCTPNKAFPSVAAQVAYNLELPSGVTVLDINAACSGFIYTLEHAHLAIQAGKYKHVLVIGAEQFSRLLDFADRSTCFLFGDGAGAIVLTAQENEPHIANGVLATQLGADTAGSVALQTPDIAKNHIVMEGKEVFRNAVRRMSTPSDALFNTANITLRDVDWIIPHQANARIIEAAATRVGVAQDNVMQTVDKHANTSAASIPLALAEGISQGLIKRGQLLYLQAFGAGYTWGEAIVRF